MFITIDDLLCKFHYNEMINSLMFLELMYLILT